VYVCVCVCVGALLSLVERERERERVESCPICGKKSIVLHTRACLLQGLSNSF